MRPGVQQEVRAGDAGFKWGHGHAAHRNKKETSVGGHMYIRKEESGKERSQRDRRGGSQIPATGELVSGRKVWSRVSDTRDQVA